jgi:hypothetical protein
MYLKGSSTDRLKVFRYIKILLISFVIFCSNGNFIVNAKEDKLFSEYKIKMGLKTKNSDYIRFYHMLFFYSNLQLAYLESKCSYDENICKNESILNNEIEYIKRKIEELDDKKHLPSFNDYFRKQSYWYIKDVDIKDGLLSSFKLKNKLDEEKYKSIKKSILEINSNLENIISLINNDKHFEISLELKRIFQINNITNIIRDLDIGKTLLKENMNTLGDIIILYFQDYDKYPDNIETFYKDAINKNYLINVINPFGYENSFLDYSKYLKMRENINLNLKGVLIYNTNEKLDAIKIFSFDDNNEIVNWEYNSLK